MHEKAAAETTFRIPAGELPKGTQAGLRFEVQAIVHGKPKIMLEH